METKPQQPKRQNENVIPSGTNPPKKTKMEKLSSTSNLSTRLLSEAADLENLNERLVDLVSGRLDYFVNSVKQFVSISGRVAKCVYPKAPEVDNILKNFHSQKATVENGITQLVRPPIENSRD